MESSESQPAAEPKAQPELPAPSAPAPAVASPSALRRTWDWFWRGRQLAEVKRWRRAQSSAIAPLEARARLLLECGVRTARPNEPLPSPGDAVAAGLFRESAYFSVRALALAAGQSNEGHAVWQALEPARLERLKAAAGEGIEQDVEVPDPQLWQLPPDQQAQRAQRLERAARALLSEIESPLRARDTLLIQRFLRIGAVLLLIVTVLGVINYLSNAAEERRDLAINKAWQASSTYSNMGCTSPIQQCSESPDFFFHTRDESNPWVEIDLGAPQRFSAVRVVNRRDCCFERATPLIVEVSSDHEHYKELVRRTTSFSSWLATFAPTSARYVRLRTSSRTSLHLAQVRVLR